MRTVFKGCYLTLDMTQKPKQLKQLPEDMRYAVFGYIRDVGDKILKQHIPQLIAYLILAYYRMSDFFQNPVKPLNISKDKRMIWVDRPKRYWVSNNAYLDRFIDCNIDLFATWKFEITSCSLIGHKNHIKFGVFSKSDDGSYSGHKFGKFAESYWYPTPLKLGVTQVIITLNTTNGLFRCNLKDKHRPFYICNIYSKQFKYIAAIAAPAEDLLCLNNRNGMKCKIMLKINTDSSINIKLIDFYTESIRNVWLYD